MKCPGIGRWEKRCRQLCLVFVQPTLLALYCAATTKNLLCGLHYIYDSYKISEWMQEANTPWVESVGSEYLLRDTSDATSNQWGNRLISLGSYLGPGYEAHFGAVTLTYRF